MKKLIASSALVVLLGGVTGVSNADHVLANQTATKEVKKDKLLKRI